MSHKWNSEWPSTCQRCGAGKVMERAMVEGWVTPPPKGEEGPDVWKSSLHRELVLLCDENCYADMGYDAVKKQKAAVIDLSNRIGWKPYDQRNTQQGSVHPVSQPVPGPSVVQTPVSNP